MAKPRIVGGKPSGVSWTWESDANDVRVGRMSVDGTISVADLVEYLRTTAPGVDLADIRINWGTVSWTRPATDEERATREAFRDDQRERLVKWERKKLVELLKKYGVPTEVSISGAFVHPDELAERDTIDKIQRDHLATRRREEEHNRMYEAES